MPFSASTRRTPAPPPQLAAVPPEPPQEVSVLGVPLALTDYERSMDWMDAMVASRHRGYVVAAAVHCVMVCQEDAELREAVLGSSLTVPDGQPLVWAMNALGHSLPNRVYGPDLMARYCERAATTGVRMYLYGGRNQGALVQLALNLRRRFPGIRIVGGYAPPFRPLTEDEEQRVADEINASERTSCGSGSASPSRRSGWRRCATSSTPPVLVGVGAAFDFHADLVSQAPS